MKLRTLRSKMKLLSGAMLSIAAFDSASAQENRSGTSSKAGASASSIQDSQLRSHLVRARENGVKQEELVEAITHLAFYAGWPGAMTAISVAKEVFEKK